MDISIYVSLIILRYVLNNVVYRIYITKCYTNSEDAKSVCGLINVVKVMSLALIFFIIAFGHP